MFLEAQCHTVLGHNITEKRTFTIVEVGREPTTMHYCSPSTQKTKKQKNNSHTHTIPSWSSCIKTASTTQSNIYGLEHQLDHDARVNWNQTHFHWISFKRKHHMSSKSYHNSATVIPDSNIFVATTCHLMQNRFHRETRLSDKVWSGFTLQKVRHRKKKWLHV